MTDLSKLSAEVREAMQYFDEQFPHQVHYQTIRAELLRLTEALEARGQLKLINQYRQWALQAQAERDELRARIEIAPQSWAVKDSLGQWIAGQDFKDTEHARYIVSGFDDHSDLECMRVALVALGDGGGK